jgi:hypothetical protein
MASKPNTATTSRDRMLNGNAAAHIKQCNRKQLFDGNTINKMVVFVA